MRNGLILAYAWSTDDLARAAAFAAGERGARGAAPAEHPSERAEGPLTGTQLTEVDGVLGR